jgi:hypothetical protein
MNLVVKGSFWDGTCGNQGEETSDATIRYFGRGYVVISVFLIPLITVYKIRI